MRTSPLNKLFEKAKNVTRINDYNYSYTCSLKLLYLSGTLTQQEVKVAESYFERYGITNFDVELGLLEYNDIKGLK